MLNSQDFPSAYHEKLLSISTRQSDCLFYRYDSNIDLLGDRQLIFSHVKDLYTLRKTTSCVAHTLMFLFFYFNFMLSG